MSKQLSVVPPAETDGRQKILFGNPVFKKDLNFTVRLGGEYAVEREINVGYYYPLYAVGEDRKAGDYLGDAEITHILSCRLKDIPKLVYTNEHDPACQNPIGLYWELREVYEKTGLTNQKSITPDTFFTCIGFVVRQ